MNRGIKYIGGFNLLGGCIRLIAMSTFEE